MLRSSASLIALCVALAATSAMAADYGTGGDGADMGLRGGLGADPGSWSGLEDDTDGLHFELGVRYWYSLGATSAGTTGGSVVSSDTTHIGELHLRIEDYPTNTYAKAIAGYAIATTGAYSGPSGSGSIADGEVSYIGGDFGWNPLAGPNGSGAGFLVGYQYWNEGLDTGRNNYTTASTSADVTYDQATGQTFLPGASAPNMVTANLLRLGVQGKAVMGPVDITAEAAAVPYAKVSGQVGVDDPVFDTSVYNGPAQAPYTGGYNGNIYQMRGSATTLDGWGYGGMGEVWLGIHPKDNMTFRVGGRAWYIQGVADARYSLVTVTNPSDSDIANPPAFDTGPTVNKTNVLETNNPFSMMRLGLMGELTYHF